MTTRLAHVLPRVAGNTVVLLVLVACATALLGTGLAWLVAGHDFPGRGFFSWALLLPLAVPGYVLAVVFAGALDFAGPLQSWLRASVHPQRCRQCSFHVCRVRLVQPVPLD